MLPINMGVVCLDAGPEKENKPLVYVKLVVKILNKQPIMNGWDIIRIITHIIML
jgi:hypothetical protein